jgi:hypothetical protein
MQSETKPGLLKRVLDEKSKLIARSEQIQY